ncbi:MAG: ion transporter [Oscillospiraceae bacterium]|nr:ion transporter [Oscillospiraceae bacterium]
MNRKRIFRIIQIGSKDDFPSRAFDMFISATIILNILVMFLESFDELSSFSGLFGIVETVTIAAFCIEYALRIWTADLLYPELSKPRAILRFLYSFDGIVDLLTILPLTFFSGFVAFRMLRVVRIFHLFRINASDDSFTVITSVLREKRNQIISSVFIVLVLMLASSLGIYNAEHEAQPDVYKNAFSGLWWSVATLLTVGYGDIYPVTVMGRIMAIITTFLGVGVVAIPTGIISAGFVEQYTKKENSAVRFSDINAIGEIKAESRSPLIGLTVAEIRNKYGVQIHLILRNDLSVIPTAGVKIKKNDVLIAHSEQYEKIKG